MNSSLINKNNLRNKIYILPNVITAFGLACGLFIIYKLNMIDEEINSYAILYSSSILLLIAAIADVLDGAVARMTHSTSEFGMFFDSISDAITFGVVPPVVLLKTLSIEQTTTLAFFITTAAIIYSICGALRLVRFNIDKTKEQTSIIQEPVSKTFTGLPIPGAATAILSLALILHSNLLANIYPISNETRTIILIVALIVIGYFMISRWKFLSLKSLHIKIKSFPAVFITTIITVLILYGIHKYFALMFFSTAWAYLIIAWVLSIIRLIAGKRAQRLADFEPEPDDPSDND